MIIAGINCRQTEGFVTEGPDDTFCLGEEYPVSRGGLNFGWNNAGSNKRNRNNTFPRLAGTNFPVNSTVTSGNIFRIDLDTASSAALGGAIEYDIRLALGDHNYAGTRYAVLQDDATGFKTIDISISGSDRFTDANGSVTYTPSEWDSGSTLLAHTFSSEIFKIKCNDGVSKLAPLAHISLEYTAGAAVVLGQPPIHSFALQRAANH